MMGLLFGHLTQDFVNFGVILGQAQTGDPAAQAALPAAAAAFRHGAGLNALYLLAIGWLSVLGLFICA